jgi:hypothetical protein
MARKIYNNTYYDDSSPLSSLFKTGLFATGVGMGIKYRKQILDKVAPYSQGRMSPYIESVMAGRDQIGANRERADSLRQHGKRVLEEQSQRLHTILSKHGARLVTPNGNKLVSGMNSFGYSDLNEVVDASGNKIGLKFQEALAGMYGQAELLGFDGTIAKFNVGSKSPLEVPFAKLNKATGTWMVNDKGTMRASSILSDMTYTNEKLGFTLMDYNTNLLTAFSDPNKRLTYMNPNVAGKDIIEAKKLGNSQARKEMHMVNMASQKLFLDTQSASDSQRVLSGIKNQAEFTYINDTHHQRMIGSTVRVNYASRVAVAQNPGMEGVDALHITSRAMGKDPMYGGGVGAYFHAPSLIRKDPTMLSVANMNGVMGFDEAMQDAGSWASGFLKHAESSFGMTGSSSQIADGMFTIRPSVSTLAAERQKAQKGIFYAMKDKAIKDMNLPLVTRSGVSQDAVNKLRFMPSAVDFNITPYGNDGFVPQQGFAGALAEVYGVEGSPKKGMLNMLTFLDTTVPDESMTINKSIFGNMNTVRPVTYNELSGVLDLKKTKGLDSRALATFKYYNKGKEITKRLPLGALVGDRKRNEYLRYVMSQQGARIDIPKGTYLGVKDPGALLTGSNALETYQLSPERLVTATDHLIVDGNNLLETIGSISKGKMSLAADSRALPSKMNIAETTWRAAISVHGEGTHAQRVATMALGDRRLANAEAIISHEIFNKIIPKNGVLQKGSTEYLQFVQNSILGHIAAYGNEDFVLGGDAAAEFSGFINGKHGSDINLSKLWREGELTFKGALSTNPEGLSAQMRSTAGVLSSMRDMLVQGKVQPINKIDEGLISRLPKHWETFKNVNAALKGTVKDQQRRSRAGTWPMWNGFMASEHTSLNQGAGFNSMRITMRDIPGLMTSMGDTLGEMQLYNRNNSFKMQHELSLMLSTWGNVERGDLAGIEQTKKLYSDRFGANIPVLSQEEVIEKMLGEHKGPRIYSTLKESSDFAAMSMLSDDINPHGFMITDGNTQRYIPSAEFLGNTYALNAEENTAQQFARKMLEGVSEWSQNANSTFDEVAAGQAGTRDSIRALMLTNTLGQSTGFNNVVGMNIEGAIYSKHLSDNAFLQNKKLMQKVMALGGDGGKELNNIFGNTIVQHQVDYKNTIKEELSKYAKIAEAEEGGLAKAGQLVNQIDKYLGEENFFSRYSNTVDQVGKHYFETSINRKGKEVTRRRIFTLDNAVDKIMSDQVRRTQVSQAFIEQMANTGDFSNMDALHKELSGLMHGLSVRYPNLYNASFGTGIVMPEINGSFFKQGNDLHKQLALGYMFRVNTTADIDGDNIMLRAAFTKKQRVQTWDRIRGVQAESAEWMKRLSSGVVSDILGAGKTVSGISLYDAIPAMAEEAVHGRPEATALAAFFTKAATGSLSIKATQAKASVRGNFDEMAASQEAIAKAEAYFGTMISGVTEQATIGSKHLQATLQKINEQIKASNTMETVEGLIGKTFNSTEGRTAIRRSIVESGSVNPMIMAAWHSLSTGGDGESKEFAKAIETIVDIQTFARDKSRAEFDQAFKMMGVDNTDDGWKAYRSHMDKVGGFFDGPEARALGVKEGESFMGFMSNAMSKSGINVERGVLGTESIPAFWQAYSNAAKQGFTGKVLDDQLAQIVGSIEKLKKYSTGLAMEAFAPKDMPGVRGPMRRRIIGIDRVTDFIDTKILSKLTPLRAAGIVGAGILGIRAINMLSGDGSPQEPEDLPSFGNPSMESRGARDISTPRTMSSIPNFNSNAGLLTDNGISHEEAMSFANQRSYVNSKSNSISIRHDGHNPYKSDMMMYE